MVTRLFFSLSTTGGETATGLGGGADGWEGGVGLAGGVATGLLKGPSAWELLIVRLECFGAENLKRVALDDDDGEVALVILMQGNAAVAADIVVLDSL